MYTCIGQKSNYTTKLIKEHSKNFSTFLPMASFNSYNYDEYAQSVLTYLRQHQISLSKLSEEDIRYIIQRMFRHIYPSTMVQIDPKTVYFMDKMFENEVLHSVYRNNDPIYVMTKNIQSWKHTYVKDQRSSSDSLDTMVL